MARTIGHKADKTVRSAGDLNDLSDHFEIGALLPCPDVVNPAVLSAPQGNGDARGVVVDVHLEPRLRYTKSG